MPKKSMPTWSARTPSSATLRIVWAWETCLPLASPLRSPKVLSPKTSGNSVGPGPHVLPRFTCPAVTSHSLSGPGLAKRLHARQDWLGADSDLELGLSQYEPEYRPAGLQHLAVAQAC